MVADRRLRRGGCRALVSFERSKADAETVIGHVLWILLHPR